MSNKSESAMGGDDAPLACAPPPMPTSGPMVLKNVIRSFLHLRGPASVPMMIDGRPVRPSTPAHHTGSLIAT